MAETTRCWDDLPDDCWKIVLDRLNQHHHHRHLESVSLVCKRFLLITNRLRSRLTISDPLIIVLRSVSKLLRRFHQLKRIDIVDFQGDLDPIVLEIASSELNLEALNFSKLEKIPVESLKNLGMKMKSLKILSFLGLQSCSSDIALILISTCFPWLEELDISYPHKDCYNSITDAGIEAITSNLRNLRKIDISGQIFLNDRSLRAIAENCEFIREIALVDCGFVSEDGISNFIRDSPNLVSLSRSGPVLTYLNSLPIGKSSFFYGKTLTSLCVYDITISKALVLSLTEANLPLQKLVLRHCTHFTFTIISSLLSTYRYLNYLDLERASFLTDQMMELLCLYLGNLTFVSLNSCFKLTSSTFFTLVKNCTFLEEIQMERTDLGREHSHSYLEKNSRIRALKLAGSKSLDDECLKKFVLVCPNLISLDVSHCSNITEKGIQGFGKLCSKISELKVNGCERIKNIGALEFPELEVLQAKRSGINNDGLQMVGKSCDELICLDLEGCSAVSDKGVKEVVGNCKRLREVSLKNCGNVSVDVVNWMVFSRPTLRKIIPPDGYVPAKDQRDLFLRYGCMVYNG